MSNNDEFLAEFVSEAREHLGHAESSLLRMSEHPDDRDAVQACFRALHTIKGGAGFLELDRIQRIAHVAEQVLDGIRTDKTPCGSEQVDALLQSVTRLEALISSLESGEASQTADEVDRALTERLHKVAQHSIDDPYAPVPDTPARQSATSRKIARQQGTPVAVAIASQAAAPAEVAPTSTGIEPKPSPAATVSVQSILGRIMALAIGDTAGLAAIVGDLRTMPGLPAATGPTIDRLAAIAAGQGEFALAWVLAGELHSSCLGGATPTSQDVPPTPTATLAIQQAADFASESEDLLGTAEGIALDQRAPDGEQIQALFRSFHTVKGMASYLGLHRVEELAHRLESELLPVRDGSVPFSAAVRNLVLAGIDGLRALVQGVRDTLQDVGPWPHAAAQVARSLGMQISVAEADIAGGEVISTDAPSIAEVLVGSGVPRAEVENAARNLKPGEDITQRLVKTGKITVAQAEQAVAKQQELAAKAGADSFARVSITRLDELMDLVGELIIAQAMVTQDEDVARSPRLAQAVARQDRLVRDLQALSLGLRMVPLKATFQKMARAVHDTARKVGKAVELRLTGEDTEIDRTLSEIIADPLLHMVRNAVDHGVEPPEARAKTGKPAKGVIQLSAEQTSEHVVIRLADDGRGMDPARLRAKGIEKGLVDPAAQLTDAQCLDLIFLPGFSTAEQVTGISGRGVGMDVVRRNVERLKGTIGIDSVVGRGSTFTIRLPLTTAILDAMLLRVAHQRYLVPMTAIVEAVRPKPGQVNEILGRGRVIASRGQLLPLIHLGDLFGVAGAISDPSASVITVIEHLGGRFALQVDEIVGLQQVVIKPIDQDMPHHQGLAGSAILGDGRVGLIIDPAHLIAA